MERNLKFTALSSYVLILCIGEMLLFMLLALRYFPRVFVDSHFQKQILLHILDVSLCHCYQATMELTK